MKKMIWFTIFSVLFLVLIVPAILGLALDIISAGEQPGYDTNKRLSIYGERGVAQKFISSGANLTAIGTSIRNPNLKNKKEVILNLYNADNKSVRTSILNGQNFQDGDFVKFIFTPIADSMNKTYVFTIFSPLAGPEETIEVFYFNLPTETILEFTYDEETYPGGFPLVTFHKPNSKFEVVKEIYSNLFSRLQLFGSQKL
ncbi:MAG: hypothetical protein AAB535_00415 [Patescibacteria group bacterium]